jgi:hypothetical protein
MDNQEKITKLEADVKELIDWKREKVQQQLTYPLDKVSTTISQRDLLVIKNRFIFLRSDGTLNFNGYIMNDVNGLGEVLVRAYSTIYEFTVDTTTDIFTSPAHRFSNTDRIFVLSTGTTPAPLQEFSTGTSYYIISSTTDTFQLSATSGGAAINITTVGTIRNFITKY